MNRQTAALGEALVAQLETRLFSPVMMLYRLAGGRVGGQMGELPIL